MSDDGMDGGPDDGGGILTGDAWDQAQYLPGAGVATMTGPGPKTKKAARKPALPLGRILTGDEWEQAQRLPGKAVKTFTIPGVPKLAVATPDVLAGPPARRTGTPLAPFDIKDPTTYANPLLRQVVNPALENPLTTTATAGVLAVPVLGQVVGAAMAAGMVHNIASYGWQKLAESQLSPEDRARAEADPERVSGEAAAVQAAMLGLAPLIHVGVKGLKGPAFGEGMMESGVSGLHEALADPSVAMERTAPFQGELNAAHAAALEHGAATTRIPAEVPKPAGFEPTTGGATLKTTPRPVQGLVAPEPATPGKVKPIETAPASAPLAERAALDQSVRDYVAQTAEQDQAALSAARQKAAEKIALADRFRPRRREVTPFVETPQGAQMLGAAAAHAGLPETASPYHPDSPLAPLWQEGHDAGTQAGADMLKSMQESGFATAPSGATTVELPASGAGRGGSTVDAVAAAKRMIGTDALRAMAEAEVQRRGGPATPEAIMAATEQVARNLASHGVPEASPSYPDGFSMGGALTDNRIPGAGEVPKAGRGSDVPVTEPAATTPPMAGESSAPPAGLVPVEGTGATKTRGLSAGVEHAAIANKLTDTLGDLPEYRAINMADQASRASDLLASDPALARRVALGEVAAPAGLLPESVFTAVEANATAEGDVATLRDLATGQLAQDATTMGQRIRALGERDPESPVAAMQRVAESRARAATVTPQATESVIATIRAQLAKAQITPEAVDAFIKSLRC